MSHHYFNTHYNNRPVEVLLGYDRPLDHFFLTIMYVQRDAVETAENPSAEKDNPTLYSDLEDADGYEQSLDYYQNKLAELGIKVPDSMFREVEQDAINQVGNRIVVHDKDGRLETIC